MHPVCDTLSVNLAAESAEQLNKHLRSAFDHTGHVAKTHWRMRGPEAVRISDLFEMTPGEVIDYTHFVAQTEQADQRRSAR